MKKIFAAVAAFCVAGVSSATSPCPEEARGHCGPNPFYVLAASLADTCARNDPEHAADYKAKLDGFVAENPRAYAALDADPEFAANLAQAKRAYQSLERAALLNECKAFLKGA